MTLTPEQIDALEALAKRHGALSYRNRADTSNPAFGFSVAGLAALLAEARRDVLEQAATALETATYRKRWARAGVNGQANNVPPCELAALIRAMKGGGSSHEPPRPRAQGPTPAGARL